MARFRVAFSFVCSLAFFLAVFSPLVLVTPSAGQVMSTGNIPTPESLMPMPEAGHDYEHLLSDTVNPANGSVSINLQLPVPKGRGISMHYSSLYNSANLYRLAENAEGLVTFMLNDQPSTMPTVTWSESTYQPPPVEECAPGTCAPTPFVMCHYATNFSFTDLSGQSHTLPMGVLAPDVNEAKDGTSINTCGAGSVIPPAPNVVGDGKVVGMFTSSSTSISDVSGWNVCSSCSPVSVAASIGPFVITDDSGNTYFFDGNCNFNTTNETCQEMPYQIEDRNGNEVTASTAIYNDTLNRPLAAEGTTRIGGTVGIPGIPNNPGGVIFVPNGNTIIGGITYPPATCPASSCPSTIAVNYPPPTQSVVLVTTPGDVPTCPQLASTPSVSGGVQSAWGGFGLPDGTQYTFYNGQFNPNDPSLANSYGLINEMIYPNGGWVKYKWMMNTTANTQDPNQLYTDEGAFAAVDKISGVPVTACYTRYGTPRLYQRIVSYDGVNVAQTQTYTYTTTWDSGWGTTNNNGVTDINGWDGKTTTVITEDNAREQTLGGTYQFKTVYNYSGGFQPGGPAQFTPPSAGGQVPVETSILYYDWTGALLQTVNKIWADVFDLQEEDITLNTGGTAKTAKTIYTYNGTAYPIRVTNKSEYDYNGSLIRSTAYTYQTFANNPNGMPVPSEPSTVKISGCPGNFSGTLCTPTSATLVAETDYTYDQTPPATVSSIIQHDPAYNSSFNSRGNVTSKTQVCIAGTGCAGNATTTYTYDIAGQVTSTTDPCGNPSCSDMPGVTNHTTVYSYTDAGANAPGNSDAYVTQVTLPPTNGIAHIENFTYDYNLGKPLSSTDQNGLATNYTYDWLGRLIETSQPNPGEDTKVTYSGESSVTTSQLITNSPSQLWKTTVSSLDGMFHVINTQLTSDTPCVDTTDTVYDGEGKVFKQSNPHCSSDTINWTQNSYDALGRTQSVLETDGSTSGSSYNANSTTTTDEVGNQRISVMDAAGRLIEVDEPWAQGTPGTPATGSFTVTGSEQNATVGPPVAGTGSVTFSGTLQSWQTQTAAATNSSGSVTINGSLQSKQVQTQTAASGSGSVFITGTADNTESIDPCFPHGSCPQTIPNGGSLSLTIDGMTATTGYGQGSTAASLSTALANGFAGNSLINVSGGGGTISFSAKNQGSSTNYPFTTSVTWNTATCPNGNPCFGASPFNFSPASGTMTGGKNNVFSTISDSGTVTITINGQPIMYTYNGAEGSTATSIAQGLAADINNGSSYATASTSGSIIFLQSRTAGASVNYSLSSSDTYDTTDFSTPSFTATNSGGTLTGGTNAQFTTNYDSGFATIAVNAHSTNYNWSGSSTTPSSIASGMATAINQDASASVNASASGATVNLTARTTGVSTNYSLNAGSTSSHSSFSTSTSGITLTGGAAAPIAFDTGTVTVMINTTPVSVGYNSSSTASSLASSLASAISSTLATTSVSGATVNLTSAQTGSAANYPLSWSSSTNQAGTFHSASFQISLSGANLTGGTDANPLGGPYTLSTPMRTLYAYDPMNNLQGVQQQGPPGTSSSLWRNRSFTYDSLSQLLTASNPESGTIKYLYDANGNVSSKTAPAPNQPVGSTATTSTNYTYDALNRVTQKSYSNDPTGTPGATYGYDGVGGSVSCPPAFTPTDPIGQRTSMCDGAGTETWSYVPNVGTGWETVDQRTTNGVTYQIPTQSNLLGSLASVTYPDTVELDYAPDGAGRTVSAIAPAVGITFVGNATYTAFGALATAQYNLGAIQINNTYNARMQPLCLGANAPAASQPAILSLCYDFHAGNHDNGNVYQLANGKDGNRTQNFTYDGLNRIQTAYTNGTNWGENFTIDPWGNLTNRSGVSGKTAYEPLNTTATVANQLTGFTYDIAGNTIQNGSTTYVYDAENRLHSTGGVTYTYDGDGNRVMKSSGTIYWGAGPLAETDLSGNIQQEYIFFNGQRIGRVDDVNGVFRYYFSNQLNSNSVDTDENGNIFRESDYYPYGGEIAVTASDPDNHYKFNGKELDSESNLYNFGARYDTYSLGRFMTPDWAAKPTDVPYAHYGNPQSLNLYAFVENNPTTFGDPDGHAPYGFDGGGVDCPTPNNCQTNMMESFNSHNTAVMAAVVDANLANKAKRKYGRQSDGSYKADPKKVQAAIDSKTPIGNGQCVTACSNLSGVTPHTDSWTPGKSVLDLNDTTDIGLAIASFGPDNKFTQPGGDQNSAIYMGHDPKTGLIMVVDQWPPPNAKQYNAPFEHPLENYGEGHNLRNNRMENNAYYYHVIVVPER